MVLPRQGGVGDARRAGGKRDTPATTETISWETEPSPMRHSYRTRLRVEELEPRGLLSPATLPAEASAIPAGHVSPAAGTNPTPVGYPPAQIRHAYGFDQITFSNG